MHEGFKLSMGKRYIQSEDRPTGFNITVQRVHFYGFRFHISIKPKYLKRLKYFFLS